MAQIINLGNFLGKDDAGVFRNECKVENVKPPWLEAVEEVKRLYLQHHSEHMHSLYLRGSIPRGLALPDISDLDTLCVFKEGATGYNFSWIQAATLDLKKKFPFVSSFEFYFLREHELLLSEEYYAYRFILKHLSLCIYGENLAERIEAFRPNLKIAIALHWKIESEIAGSIDFFRTGARPAEIETRCRWIMKRILRTGLAMLIEEEREYTRDLFLCYRVFVKHFPDQEKNMRRVLEWAVNATSDGPELADFLETLQPNFLPMVRRRLFAPR